MDSGLGRIGWLLVYVLGAYVAGRVHEKIEARSRRSIPIGPEKKKAAQRGNEPAEGGLLDSLRHIGGT